MNEQQVSGLILIILGGLHVVRPDLILRFQIWTQKLIMGATYIPSARTTKTIRILGAVISTLGLFVVTGLIGA